MHPLAKRFLVKTIGGAAVLAFAVPVLQSQQLSLSNQESDQHAAVLRVTGSIAELVPGKAGRLELTVHNDGDGPAVVQRLSAVPGAEVDGCTIRLSPWTGRLELAAGARAKRVLAVVVSGRRCSGAHWRLDYTAEAVG